jgi:hypothetical protein
VCPWHGWEYSVVTGRGPEGYDEEQVPVFDVDERADGVYVATPATSPRRLLKHKPSHLLEEHPKPAGAPPRARPRRRRGRGEPALLHLRRSSSTRSTTPAASSARSQARAPRRARVPGLRGLLLEERVGVHLALLDHADGPRRPARPRLRGSRPLGGRRPRRDAHPLGRRELALLPHGGADELHPEPDHDPRPGAHPRQGGGLRRGGRPGQRPGRGRRCWASGQLGRVPPFPFIAHSRGWDAGTWAQHGPRARERAPGKRPSWRTGRSTTGGLDRHRAELDKPMERSGRKAQRLAPRAETPA